MGEDNESDLNIAALRAELSNVQTELVWLRWVLLLVALGLMIAVFRYI